MSISLTGASPWPPDSSIAVERTAKRKLSAAAKVSRPPLTRARTPVKTGRASSVAAAKATSAIIARSSPALTVSGGCPPSAVGIAGNSPGSIPRIVAWLRWSLTFRLCPDGCNASVTSVGGSVLTKSVSRRDGLVVPPSSWMLAGTQQVMPISRLVAERRRRPFSAASRILERIGSVLRVETAWLTVESPRARSCCLQVSFTGGPPQMEYLHIKTDDWYSRERPAMIATRSLSIPCSLSFLRMPPPSGSPMLEWLEHHQPEQDHQADAAGQRRQPRAQRR